MLFKKKSSAESPIKRTIFYVFWIVLLFFLFLIFKAIYNAFFSNSRMFKESVEEVEKNHIPTIRQQYLDKFQKLPEHVKAEFYVRTAENLAYYLSTRKDYWWFQRLWEYDESAYLLLSLIQFDSEIDAINVHYAKITDSRIELDIMRKLNQEYLDKLQASGSPFFGGIVMPDGGIGGNE
jgi:hypothetical protein